MSKDQHKPDGPDAGPSEDKLERIARESGTSKDQVAQLARVTDSDAELTDAAEAAARWS